MDNKNIAILGLGVVGGGVVKLLISKKKNLTARTGFEITIAKVLELRPERLTDLGLSSEKNARSIEDILSDPTIEIVVEVMGGSGFAYECVKKSLCAGKSVITSNKELIAKHGIELQHLAQEHGVDLYCEAAVGGGIPLLTTLENELIANDINSFKGILNGTTNYILTKMRDEGLDFDTALQKAQQLGYAEADPTADVEGYDTQYKLSIVARLLFGIAVKPDEIAREGITRIKSVDLKVAEQWGYSLKLLALGQVTKPAGTYILRCTPTLLNHRHQLSHVDDVFNAFFLTGDAVGDMMFYGRGAGSLPTASAVVSDIVRALRKTSHPRLRLPLSVDYTLKPLDFLETKFYIRISSSDSKTVMKKLAEVHVPTEKTTTVDNNTLVMTTAIQETFLRDALVNLPYPSYTIRIAD